MTTRKQSDMKWFAVARIGACVCGVVMWIATGVIAAPVLPGAAKPSGPRG